MKFAGALTLAAVLAASLTGIQAFAQKPPKPTVTAYTIDGGWKSERGNRNGTVGYFTINQQTTETVFGSFQPENPAAGLMVSNGGCSVSRRIIGPYDFYIEKTCLNAADTSAKRLAAPVSVVQFRIMSDRQIGVCGTGTRENGVAVLNNYTYYCNLDTFVPMSVNEVSLAGMR